MRLGAILLVACGGGGAWQPRVVSELEDPKAHTVAVEFTDGQNGTQLLLAVLGQAKTANTSAISHLEIQVGRCTRRVEAAGAGAGATMAVDPELDAITLRAQETKYTCQKLVEQVLTPRGGGAFGQAGLSDAQMQERTDCQLAPIEHVVTRYRFELDHKFVPPDWDEVAKWTKARLAFGPPRCGGEAKSEIRARFHSASKPHPAPPLPAMIATPEMILSFVERAQVAASSGKPGEAVHLAQQAIAAFADGGALAGLDETKKQLVAGALAAAMFFAVEIDVDKFKKIELPLQIDDTWARETGAQLDRIAKRYERIKDLVRLPIATRWLRAGAGRLGELHLHLADLLDQAGQKTSAESEREKARALAAQAAG
jgi:hypothetical protein